MAPKQQFAELATQPKEGERNIYKLYCPYNNCSSVILSPGMGILRRRAQIPKSFTDLEKDEKELSTSESDREDDLFWVLEDPFDFDNLGFSKSSSAGVKYLACADCDRGPLGYHDSNFVAEEGGKEFLLRANLVLYVLSH
ncbi:Mss4-like protein [Lipomyces orientalis]|uniref:Mss4-like protein n=1 Tax=Lipomyces orientalis TaxID=1233043 RepID=A0ACC3TTA6_9ASCO